MSKTAYGQPTIQQPKQKTTKRNEPTRPKH